MRTLTKRRVAILGASRGLGRALAEHCSLDSSVQSLFLVSRNPASQSAEPPSKTKLFSFDLSSSDFGQLFAELGEFRPSHIFYMAAGGPYTGFEKSKWRSHAWALRVSLLGAAEILHWFMQQEEGLSGSHQFTLLGSSVAESKADPKAASYAASKHALLGLYRSIAAENPSLDVRLFSPGYMDTDLLPKGSWPRLQPEAQLWDPKLVAEHLWAWCRDSGQRHQHKSLEPFANTPRNPL